MSHARVDDWMDQDAPTRTFGNLNGTLAGAIEPDKVGRRARIAVGSSGPRRTPRVSLIVVLRDDEVVEADLLALHLSSERSEDVDITIACAGQPSNLEALQKTARTATFLLAPAGTTAEDLRELAMAQTPGDIVTLISGAHLCSPRERVPPVSS